MKKKNAIINHFRSYADAFTKASKATGAIRCTFASAFNEKGMPIFCFQSKMFPGALVEAEYTSATDRYSLIPATLTPEAAAVLETYWNEIIKKDYLTGNGKRLAAYFDESGRLITRTVLINPHDLAWTPKNTIKSNWAWLLAAGAALFAN